MLWKAGGRCERVLYRGRMRRMLGFAAIAVMLAVSGCVPEPVLPTLPPTPTAAPVFASEEEALAAAEDAYAKYQEVSNAIAAEGGAEPERITPHVTSAQLENELATAKLYRDNGWRTTGPVTFDTVTLQSFTQEGSHVEVVMYLCLDATAARLSDAEGVDVTPPNRIDRAPFEITLVAQGTEALRVSNSEPWSSHDFC